MSTGLADIPKGWEVVEQTPVPKGWEVIPFDENATKFAEVASERIAQLPLGVGFEAVAHGTPPEYREHVAKALQQRLQAGEGGGKKLQEQTGGLTALNFVEGALDFAAPLARLTGTIPRLDPEQERFKQQLQAIQQGEDPLLSEGFLARTTQQASRMAVPMAMGLGTGMALRGAGAVAGLGSKAQTALMAAGVSGSTYPRVSDQTYAQLIGEGVDPGTATTITRISAPIEAAIESIVPDPLSPGSVALRGGVRAFASRLLMENVKRYGKELGEEALQGMVRQTAMEAARLADEELPNEGIGSILREGLSSGAEAAGPLALMMSPGAAIQTAGDLQGRRERYLRYKQLKEIRAKGYVTADDGKSAGIPGETRKERVKNADAEIQQIEKEIQDAGTIRGPETEVRQEQGGEDLRGIGQEQVPAQPTGEVAPAPEVQVAPPQEKSRGVKPVEPVQPPEPPADLARRAARGESVERPEGISEARWKAMIAQQAKRLGLKPPTAIEQAPTPAPEAPPQPQAQEPVPTPEVQPEAPQEPTEAPEDKPKKSRGKKVAPPEQGETSEQQPRDTAGEEGTGGVGAGGRDLASRATPGKAGKLALAGQQPRDIRYYVVEDEGIVPSHDARRNFAQNPQGDKNERPYHDPKEGASSRAIVEEIAKADPSKIDLLVSDTLSATDGPPIVNSQGVVLGGNARSMAIQLAYSHSGEAAARMKDAMVRAAEKFGLDPAAIAKMERPIIVRELADAGQRGEMSAILNEPLTAGKSQATIAASRGSKVTDRTADMLSGMMAPDDKGETPSVRDVLRTPKNAQRILESLVKDGALTERDVDQYIDPDTSEFNDAGRAAVEELLLGKIVGDPSIIGDMAPSVRNKVLSAIGPLVRGMSDKTHGERFTKAIRAVIEALPGFQASGRSASQYFMQQKSFLQEVPGLGDKAVATLAEQLLKLGPVKFRAAIKEINELLGVESGQKQKGLFGEGEKAASFDEAVAKHFAPEFGTDVSQTLGISGVPLGGQRSGIGPSIRHFFQRFFTSRGELPVEVYDAKVRKEGRVAKEMNTLRNTAADFRRGIRKALGGKELTQADVERMNAVLRSEEAPSTVPENVRAPIQAMRDHIDALSRAMIAEGVAQGDLVGIIEENEGVYATRSYRVFDDPKWRDKVPEGIRNRAIAEIRQMYPGKSDAEVIGMLESLLFRGAADSPVALLKGSKLGSKDLSTFMERKDIPEWLRDLWGEYKDAGVNYARSVFKMSHLLANQEFLNRVRAEGLGKWLRTQEDGPIVNEFGEVITPIAAEGSSVMSPLNGLLTTPEIKKAFERFDSPGAMPEWLRLMMSVNYAVKYGKTVGSMMTHIRNTISNTGFAVANGHWRLDKAGKAIWATATGTFQLPNAEFRAYYNRLAELGIVGEDVRAGELKDALRDASEANIDEFLYNREARHAKKIVNAGRASLRFFNSLYQAEDGVWKIYAWENEKARYAKAHPEWSEQQVEEEAARIVRDTYPTYSKIPEGVKVLRRLPFYGTFVSFPSEVVRTTFHTIKLGIEEMQAPETRSIGAQRLAGTAIAIGGLSVLTRAVMAALGIGDDEDDDLRWFVPPWQENSQLLYTSKPENATYRFIDLGYSDPHAYLTDAVTAFMRGEDWKESLVNSTAEFLAPFASEEILTKAALDVRSNADGKVYNPEDEVGEQAKDITQYMWQHALEPGTISSLRRIQTAAAGTDPNRDVKTEVTAVVTGQRLQKVDVEHSLGFRVRDFGKALTRIQGIARKTATSRGTATGEMVATDFARMEKLRLAKFSEMQRIVGAARRLGVPEENIRGMLMDELPDDVAEQLMTGDYSPYEMTPQTVQQMLQARPEEFMERFGAWHGDKAPEAIREAAMPKIGNLPLSDKPEDERERAEAKQMLDAMGISRSQAEDLLRQYYRRPNKSGKKQSERRADDPTKFDPSYLARRKALRELYGD